MCGLAGLIDRGRQRSRERFVDELARMTSAIMHRGPDDSGAWTDVHSGVGLGFRRLSIIDLSPAGHQPMESATGRYVITFNGEVYNFERLRAELALDGQTRTWRGHSDTEVILACVEAWGLDAAVQKFIGMFAFALWDRETATLSLVRDRLGVKPLYYGWSGDVLAFGSELKALRAHERFDTELDRDAVALHLKHSYIPAPHTIYRNVRKVMPGTIATFSPHNLRDVKTRPYWSAQAVAEAGQRSLVTSDAVAIAELEELLRDAVRLRMISDVPLGVFLSGGIDSSLVTALMQAEAGRPVKSFTIGFREGAYDEAEHARAVARHIGTDHTEIYVTPAEAQAVIPKLASMYDEPFGDSSQIPTHLVSALARRDVTVVLSGDGGDELFAGYNRYRWTEPIWNLARRMPGPVARGAGATLRGIASPNALAGRLVERLLPAKRRPRLFRDKLRKIGNIFSVDSANEAYRSLVSQIADAESVVIGANRATTLLDDVSITAGITGIAERMMLLDTLTYLPDDILTKVDRASMAVSLEAREPLLDHRIAEYAWRLPLSMKIRDGASKWILRQVLYRHVPQELIDRPKMGFGVPLDVWLRTDLRDWAETFLDERRLASEGILQPERIRSIWKSHLSGEEDVQHHLWNVLMFETWLEEQRSNEAAARASVTAPLAVQSV